jgi:hypothetical protein
MYTKEVRFSILQTGSTPAFECVPGTEENIEGVKKSFQHSPCFSAGQ